ncbi:unnamed protein product [Caenorhabditis auriculariae]|uniref:C2H2-type domain-containing protein n=1 Tax=Caenorhabditis auriculariae TaxID=2777116 RepID=A0A8S1GTC1_9PELO|nr:unnamed protein product [Caenorhabditis auriculariae]
MNDEAAYHKNENLGFTRSRLSTIHGNTYEIVVQNQENEEEELIEDRGEEEETYQQEEFVECYEQAEPRVEYIINEPVEEVVDEVVEETVEEQEEAVELPKIHCMFCDAVVDLEAGHSHHMCKSFLRKNFKCNMCDEQFNFSQNYEVHRQVCHFEKESFSGEKTCEICFLNNQPTFSPLSSIYRTFEDASTQFENQAVFKRHKRQVHRDEGSQLNEVAFCPKCEVQIPVEEVSIHLKLHDTHKSLSVREEVRREKKLDSNWTADGKKKHQCPTCQKFFRRPAELKRHLVIHVRETNANLPKWKCAICSKEYSHETGLNEHKRVAHGSATEYVCQICGFSFTKQSNLERHLKKQHPVKLSCAQTDSSLECSYCPSVYASFHALAAHQKRNHRSTKDGNYMAPNQCTICKLSFQGMAMLRAHKAQYHPTNQNITREEQTPMFECDRCSKKYLLRASLLLHLDMHRRNEEVPVAIKLPSNKGFQCETCRELFATKKDFKSHTCPTTSRNDARTIQTVVDNPNNINKIVCRLCTPYKKFSTMREFREHNRRHQQRRPHLCWICHKSFRTEDLLVLHKGIHNRDPIACESCGMVLYGRTMYRQHQRTAHPTGDDVCVQVVIEHDRNVASAQSFPEYSLRDVNGTSFDVVRAQSADWMEPQQQQQQIVVIETADTTSMMNVPIRCDVCMHLYDNMNLLIHHWNESASERDHSFSVLGCPICKLNIRGASEVAKHIQTHHYRSSVRPTYSLMAVNNEERNASRSKDAENKTHVCSVCSRGFGKRCDLSRHLLIHTGEKPFQCEVCFMEFRTKNTLDTHLLRHKNEPTEVCMVCRKVFYGKKSLKLHLRIHTGETPLQCRHCNVSFRTSSLRSAHEKRVHGVNGEPVDQTNSMLVIPPSQVPSSQRKSRRLQIKETIASKPSSVRTLLPVKRKFVEEKNPFIQGVEKTISQISSLPSKPLPLSSSSAFSCPKTRRTGGTLYIVAKKVFIDEYVINVSTRPPPKNSIRESVDTLSSIEISAVEEFVSHGFPFRIILHDNQYLHIDAPALLAIIEADGQVSAKTKITSGLSAQPKLFEVVRDTETSFVRRCEVCEMDFQSKDLSDEHFASEDHETAQLMNPLTSIVAEGIVATSMTVPHPAPTRKEELSDFTCKLCGRKFLDMEPLVAHIRREHERDGDHPQHIPPRPAARTAPIH